MTGFFFVAPIQKTSSQGSHVSNPWSCQSRLICLLLRFVDEGKPENYAPHPRELSLRLRDTCSADPSSDMPLLVVVLIPNWGSVFCLFRCFAYFGFGCFDRLFWHLCVSAFSHLHRIRERDLPRRSQQWSSWQTCQSPPPPHTDPQRGTPLLPHPRLPRAPFTARPICGALG